MPGVSGGAIYHVGGLKLNDVSFTDNSAGQDGLAIGSSSCSSTSVELEGVDFAGNRMYCPEGLYQRYTDVVSILNGLRCIRK